MADYTTIITAEGSVSCTKDEYEEFKALLYSHAEGEEGGHGFEAEYLDDGIYLYAPENGFSEFLPRNALEYFGELMKRAGLAYLSFGYAETCSKLHAGSCAGGFFRLLPNGEWVFPDLKWPENAT